MYVENTPWTKLEAVWTPPAHPSYCLSGVVSFTSLLLSRHLKKGYVCMETLNKMYFVGLILALLTPLCDFQTKEDNHQNSTIAMTILKSIHNHKVTIPSKFSDR
jgi:hypothetical protein